MEAQLILDRYRPLGMLGEGGSGSVVLAWDTRIQRRVAIKRIPLPLDAAGSPDHRTPGLTEARTAAMLSHPAIVAVYDFATDSDEAFIIMEYVDGASLDAVLRELGEPFSLDEVAAVVDAVGSALQYAHENGVLHLDIKPANILVTRDGHIKVADFGVSALSSATGHGGAGGGTVGYMPLEQLDGEPVDEATDEWALASVTYELLTDTNPFDAETTADAVARLEALAPLPSAFNDAVTDALDLVLLGALETDPDDRYPDVASLTRALMPRLGDPAVGRALLAELVAPMTEEDLAEEEPDLARLGLWDRLQGRTGGALLRAAAALECAWLAWAGLAPLALALPALAAACALVALAGLLAPALGAGVALAVFSGGLFVRGWWFLGAGFVAGGAVWWWFAGRKRSGAASLALAAPLLGVVGLPLATPFLAGFALTPLAAAAAALAGGAFCTLTSVASSAAVPYLTVDGPLLVDGSASAQTVLAALGDALGNPGTWIALASWTLAALVMSLLSRRASRAWAAFGAAAAAAVLLGGYGMTQWAASATGAGGSWFGAAFAVALVCSLILIALVIALGAPVRGEEEQLDDTEDEWDE